MRRAASATLSTLPAHKTALKQISSQSGWSQRGQGGSGKVEDLPVPPEVGVVQRRGEEAGPRRDGGDEVMKVPGDGLGDAALDERQVEDLGEVADLSPPGDVPVHVVAVAVEAAAADDDREARVEQGGVDAVVAAEPGPPRPAGQVGLGRDGVGRREWGCGWGADE